MTRHQRRQVRRRSLRCERLEDRRLLATIQVTSLDDTVDFNDGQTTLREAVFAANTVPGADEIIFTGPAFSGIRTITLQLGELLITDPLTITGPVNGPVFASPLTIDGRGEARIINFESGGELTLTRITLNHGRVTIDNPPNDPFSTLGSGGALRATTAGRVTLNEVTVINSTTTGANGDGGGVFVAGSLEVINSRFAGNRADGADAEGGSIAVRGPLSMQSSQISRSRAARGGGVAAFDTVEMTASTLDDNTAFDDVLGAGGGLYAAGVSATLSNSTISGNAAQVTGTDGRAHGGGVFAHGILSIAHSTIASNTASSLGVGAEAVGGGVFAAGALDVLSSIIAGNFTTELSADVHATGAMTFAYSLLGDNQGTTLAEAPIARPDAKGNLVGGPVYGLVDPLISPLAKNGGSTLTHALNYGSPAISSGDPAATPGVGDTPVTDQRGVGFSRRNGTRVDMGAVENSLPTWVVDTLADEDDQDYGARDLSLREAVRLANASIGAGIIEFSTALNAAGPATILLTQGELAVTGAIDIRGPGSAALTIDASGSDPTPAVKSGDGSRIFAMNDVSSGLLTPMFLSRLTLRGGDAAGDGGAIQSMDILTLTDVRLTANAATARGGAVSAPQLSLVASRVDENRAAAGAVFASQYLTIERTAITGNQATAGAGGVFAVTNFDTIISQSVISENTSETTAGGVRVDGGRVYVFETLVQGNRGVTGGMTINGFFEMANSSVVNNRGTETGGIRTTQSGTAIIEQSTVSGNRSGNGTGGIQADSPLLIRQSSIVNNVTETGAVGGVAGAGLRLTHSIVAGNLRDLTTPSDLGGPVPLALQFSLIGSNDWTDLVETPVGAPDEDGNVIGGRLQNAIEPLLGPLADNGGVLTLPGGAKLLTHRPLAGSPAIDAGDAAIEAGVGETPSFDQRGRPFSRVVGARIDIGAVESIGAPIVVDTLADESDGDYRRGDFSLREAIALANAQPGADTIVFDPALFIGGMGRIVLSLGELPITQALTVVGPGAALLTIDASGSDPTPELDKGDGIRAFADQFRPGPAGYPIPLAFALSGMTITGGDVAGQGGAVQSVVNVTISDCLLVDNAARAGGGAVSARWLTVRDSTVERNFAGGATSNVFGGGLAALEVVLDRSTVRNNTSAGGGGGVHAWQGLTIRDSVLSGNSAAGHGGGVWSGGVVVVTRALFDQNSAGSMTQQFHGGAIYLAGARDVTITSATLANNFAGGRGGAIYANSNTRGLTLVQSTVTGNAARVAGGIEATTVTVRHSTVVGNGRIGVGNDFVTGGGIVGRAVTLEHSIVAGNSLSQSPASDVQGFVSAQWSLIGDGRGSGLADAPVGSPSAQGNLVGGSVYGAIDPLLGPLASNGGPLLAGDLALLTRAPLTGSPVIDAGNPALAAGVQGAPEFDQRGAPFTRVAGSRVDMGAVEVQASGGALSGDFNLDGRVDGSDFLAWQRGVGRTGVVTIRHGDATADGDVDGNDLAVWKARAVEAASGVRGQESGVSQRGAVSDARGELPGTHSATADAVFAAGDFSGLFVVNQSTSGARAKWRPARRG